MESIVVIQARTTSSRLPGKVLLPLCGYPVAILAARRAANTGKQVILVTSDEASDDALTWMAQIHKVACFRGSLEDPLNRIVQALVSYRDETLVFRLTADNVLPDGRLLDEVETDFIEKKCDYLSCNGQPSGLPYGVSVEATKLKHLREASQAAQTPYDREHVTPYIIRRFGARAFDKYLPLGMGHFRATIDCLDDYLSVEAIFRNVDDPIQESLFALIDRLRGLPYQPKVKRPISRLVVGTAQLGMPYGIANLGSKPDLALSSLIIKTAIANGVSYLDTARAYGDSERMIGTVLKGWEGRVRIITKLSPLSDVAEMPDAEIQALVDASVFKSCASLEVQNLDILLLHRAQHFDAYEGAVISRLRRLRDDGVIGDIGVSVQDPAEADRALNEEDICFIQMPFNLLDARWDNVISKIIRHKQMRSLVVHARSTLLQGLLTTEREDLWALANVPDPKHIISWLRHQTDSCKRSSVVDLCFAFVNAQKWLDGIVVGMETMLQLEENLELFCHEALSNDEVMAIASTRPDVTSATLNPAFWKKSI